MRPKQPTDPVKNVSLQNEIPDMLIWTEAYRPQNLNMYVKFGIESHFEVENAQFLRLEPIFVGQRPP